MGWGIRALLWGGVMMDDEGEEEKCCSYTGNSPHAILLRKETQLGAAAEAAAGSVYVFTSRLG